MTNSSNVKSKSINREKIERCENSTITEAWALIRGVPRELGNIAHSEMKAIEYRLQKGIQGFKIDPTIVAVQNIQGPIAPFWNFQGSWDSGKKLVRSGHEYLSIHTLCNPPSNRYDRFDTEIQPNLEKLIDLINEALPEDGGTKKKVHSVGFGYVNTFIFKNTSKLNPSDYFNLSVGLSLGANVGVVSQFKTSFNIVSKKKDYSIVVDILAGQVVGEKDSYEIVTQIHAEKLCEKSISYAEKAELIEVVKDVQKIAKLNFYRFATDKTLTEMGAIEYA